MTIGRAMVLAAGRGERLRPVTDTLPKPLVEIAGRSLLDRMLDRLAGMELVAVNAWHLADRIADHLARRTAPPPTVVLREPELLDTADCATPCPISGPPPSWPVPATCC